MSPAVPGPMETPGRAFFQATLDGVPNVFLPNATDDLVVEDPTATFVAQERVVRVRPGAFFSLYRAGGHLFAVVCLVIGGALWVLNTASSGGGSHESLPGRA